MQVRFFAGYGFEVSYASHDAMLRDGYEKGVPMGSDLKENTGGKKAPTFVVWALKDLKDTGRGPEKKNPKHWSCSFDVVNISKYNISHTFWKA